MRTCADGIKHAASGSTSSYNKAPVVGTGMETKAAVDSGVCVVAKAGTIESSESNQIIVKK